MNTPTSPYNHNHNSNSPQQPHFQQHHNNAVAPHQQPPQQQPQQQNFKYANGPQLYPPMSRLMYVPPLTPPSSEPGSPGGTMQGPPRRTPPPPYHAPAPQHNPVNPPIARLTSQGLQKYNRRNNPELEKRRVHHCDFIGEYWAKIERSV